MQHGRFEYAQFVAAVRLRRVHRDVGLHEQCLGRLTAVSYAKAQAGPAPDGLAVHVDGSAEGLQDPVPHRRGLGGRAGGQQHGKFVPAQPGHHVLLADAGSDPLPHFDQYLVADRVAQGIIDALEGVKVQQQQRRRHPAVVRLRLGLVDGADQRGAVVEARQGIGEGHLLQLPVGRLEHLGPRFHALLQLLVDHLEVLGEQVGAHDHGVELVPRFRDFNARMQLTRGEPDYAVEELPEPGIAVVKHLRHYAASGPANQFRASRSEVKYCARAERNSAPRRKCPSSRSTGLSPTSAQEDTVAMAAKAARAVRLTDAIPLRCSTTAALRSPTRSPICWRNWAMVAALRSAPGGSTAHTARFGSTVQATPAAV